jgi:hypothetical protein
MAVHFKEQEIWSFGDFVLRYCPNVQPSVLAFASDHAGASSIQVTSVVCSNQMLPPSISHQRSYHNNDYRREFEGHM